MAVTTDLQAILFAALNTAYGVDNASGGMAETSASNEARVSRFILDSDPNYDEDRLPNLRGQVVVSIVERDDPTLGSAADGTSVDLLVRMLVLTRRDTNRSKQNALNARIRTVFDSATPSSGSTWRFSELSRTGGRQLRATKKLQRYVHEFACAAVYDESSDDAPVLGRTVILTFSSDTGVTAKMQAKQVSVSMSSPSRGVTLWGDTAERRTRRAQSVRMTCAFTVRETWPELVAIAQRDAGVRIDVASSTFDLFNMIIEDVRIQSVAPRLVRVELDLVGTATGLPGTLVVLTA